MENNIKLGSIIETDMHIIEYVNSREGVVIKIFNEASYNSVNPKPIISLLESELTDIYNYLLTFKYKGN